METHIEKKYIFDAGAQLMAGSRVTKQKPGTTRKYPFDAVKCRSMMETQVKKKYTLDAGAQKPGATGARKHPFDAVKCQTHPTSSLHGNPAHSA